MLPPQHHSHYRRPDTVNEKLYVITPIFNPARYRTRWKHYKNFEKHILESGAHLITIECVFGRRAEAIIQSQHPNHTVIHVRTEHEMWVKENMINVAVQHLTRMDPDWKYVSYVDADFLFIRPDWVGECIQKLQHYPVVQMFSHAAYLNNDYEITNNIIGFVNGWKQGIPFKNSKGIVQDESFFTEQVGKYSHHCNKIGWAGQPGGAWAYTREAWNALGGLYEYAILGSGDYHMSTALMGFANISLQEGYSSEYKKSILDWQERALRHIKKKVGFMQGTIVHYFHGHMKNRKYETRWKVLVNHKYTPLTDVKKDVQGILQLEDLKWKFRDELQSYFFVRDEDSF